VGEIKLVLQQRPATSLEVGLLIASGRTADVFAWGEGQVLKLYHNWFGLEDIRFEQRTARAIQASGLPVPAVGEIIQVNGRNGLIYQRVGGIPMWEVLARQPWRMIDFARRSAELHATLHLTIAPTDLPDQHRRLQRKIGQAEGLAEEIRRRALAALGNLPAGNSICHGDFYPGNILIAGRDEVIIDWMDASRGNPLADLARSTIIILGAAATAQIPQAGMKAFLRLFHALYLRRYFRLRPGGYTEYRRWLPVVAAARLSENIPELEQWLVAQAAGLD
jgi:aminoglycoside phosphotransferase (APT) family kinase protein